MNRYICIHGHFYQPPRENPWLEEVEPQESAYPYHDWNQRITAECYARNTASRIMGANRKINRITNNYARISFDFGPTLLSWLERHRLSVYQSILKADRISRETFSGHGSALAQVYNHLIMPLANRRDKRTQVIWGIRDFQSRFQRDPEGMWLAETAVDLDSLEIMAEEGILFTILAPRQAARVRRLGEENWLDVSGERINPQYPYLCRLPSGRQIVIFFYDGDISQQVAFGGLLHNGEAFALRLLQAFPDSPASSSLVHVAIDGETFGHHHRFGDMALAYCLNYLEEKGLARITVYGEYLAQLPPTHEVGIFENSSWSCAHGVERWKSDCGCSTGSHRGWQQGWRAPLREALDWLRDRSDELYFKELKGLISDPEALRDDYIRVILNRRRENIREFLRKHSAGKISPPEFSRILKLLEMQRHSLLMYTSCGWFFDEISGLETVQIIKYAARVIQLASQTGRELEEGFLKILARAPSNIEEFQNGKGVYEKLVRPSRISLFQVGVHYGVSSLFEKHPATARIYCYNAESVFDEQFVSDRWKLVLGRARITSIVDWEESIINFAVLHLGDHNLIGGASPEMDEQTFQALREQMEPAFGRRNVPEIIGLLDRYFGGHGYTLGDLFQDEQQQALRKILEGTRKELEGSFRRICRRYYPIMEMLREARLSLPRTLAAPLTFMLNADFRLLLEDPKLNFKKIREITEESRRWSVKLDEPALNHLAGRKVVDLLEELTRRPRDLKLLRSIGSFLEIVASLPFEVNLWEAQNIFFSLNQSIVPAVRSERKSGDKKAKRWLEAFTQLARNLGVSVDN